MAAAVSDGTPSEGSDDSAAIDVADLVNQYGIAVRAGALTPQMEDEIRLRELAGLPPMSEAAKEFWASKNHTRQPITLAQAGGASPFGDQSFVDTGDPVEA